MTMIDREENEYMGKPSSNNHLHAQPFWKNKTVTPNVSLDRDQSLQSSK